MAHNEPSFFRYFYNKPDVHIVRMPSGQARLASSLFLNNELSVDDGEKCTAQETAGRNPGCGVSAVPKAKFAELNLVVKPDPMPENDAHCVVLGITQKTAKKLAKASMIVVQLPDLVVVDGDGRETTSAA